MHDIIVLKLPTSNIDSVVDQYPMARIFEIDTIANSEEWLLDLFEKVQGLSLTNEFFVILSSDIIFDFSYTRPKWEQEFIYVWRDHHSQAKVVLFNKRTHTKYKYLEIQNKTAIICVTTPEWKNTKIDDSIELFMDGLYDSEFSFMEQAIALARIKAETDEFFIVMPGLDTTNFDFKYTRPTWEYGYTYIWFPNKNHEEFGVILANRKNDRFEYKFFDEKNIGFITCDIIYVDNGTQSVKSNILKQDNPLVVTSSVLDINLIIKKAKEVSTTHDFFIIMPDVDTSEFNFCRPPQILKSDRQFVYAWKPDKSDYVGVMLASKDSDPGLKFVTDQTVKLIPPRIYSIKTDTRKQKIYGQNANVVEISENEIPELIKKKEQTFCYFIKDSVDITFDFMWVPPIWDAGYIHLWNGNIAPSKKLGNHMIFQLVNTGDYNSNKTKEMEYFNKDSFYDIFFIRSNDHPHPASVWRELKSKFGSRMKTLPESNQGLMKQTIDCLRMTKTEMFYLVTPLVMPDFEYKHNIDEEWKEKIIHTWYSEHDDHMPGLFLVPRDFQLNFEKQLNIGTFNEPPYDVFFLSYQEENADENYERLKTVCPWAKRVHGIKGIVAAHQTCADQAESQMFYVVDGDNWITKFNFSWKPTLSNRNGVHVWRSVNPVNDLVYGYGGVKLLPTQSVKNLKPNVVDMTTSISQKFIVQKDIISETRFNTSAFNAWKAAFRECVKLSSKIIPGQKDQETELRLNLWRTVGMNRNFGNFSILGANQGFEFGSEFATDHEKLKMINDFSWLQNKFASECNDK